MSEALRRGPANRIAVRGLWSVAVRGAEPTISACQRRVTSVAQYQARDRSTIRVIGRRPVGPVPARVGIVDADLRKRRDAVNVRRRHSTKHCGGEKARNKSQQQSFLDRSLATSD